MNQQYEPVLCYRCEVPISTLRDLCTAEIAKELEPFDYRCFVNEARERNTFARLVLRQVNNPELDRMIRYRPNFLVFFILVSVGYSLAILYKGLGIILAAFIGFFMLSMFVAAYLITQRTINRIEALKRKSFELFESKLPE